MQALARDGGPVLVYSSYEKVRLRDLAPHVPDLAVELGAIVDRLVDLLPIVRNHVYHPDFVGSFSIKKVGPALASAVTYEDLTEISDGAAAPYVLAPFGRS